MFWDQIRTENNRKEPTENFGKPTSVTSCAKRQTCDLMTRLYSSGPVTLQISRDTQPGKSMEGLCLTEDRSRCRSVRTRVGHHGQAGVCVATVACCVARRRMRNRHGDVRNPAHRIIPPHRRHEPIGTRSDPSHSWNSRQLIPEVTQWAMPNIAEDYSSCAQPVQADC